jgi:sigma-E factor negative regulatory protein RseB
MDGATVVLNQVNKGFEVSVVGKIPSTTAKKIADSIVLLTQTKK